MTSEDAQAIVTAIHQLGRTIGLALFGLELVICACAISYLITKK